MNLVFRFLALFALMCISACSAQTITLTKIYQSNQCAGDVAGLIQIRSQEKLEKLKARRFGSKNTQPLIDWSKQTVVYLGLGRKANSGYGLQLLQTEVSVKNQKVELPIQFLQPQKGKNYAQVLVSPCLVVSLPKGGYRVLGAGNFTLKLQSQGG